MQRNAMKDLLAWKDSPTRKPLIVNGARQVGKTWLVLDFGHRAFQNVAHITFLENEEMQQAFAGTLDPNRLLTILSAATGTTLQDGNTLLFLDEIQECPRAITSLKLFQEQRPDIPIISAGSLLGLALNRDKDGKGGSSSWPVGKVNHLDMHPMTFDEYVEAVAGEQLADILRSADFSLIGPFGERLRELLKTYLYVGGMPEVVKTYVDTGSFEQVRAVQHDLLNDYEHDFSKHVDSPTDTERIRQTWRSVPLQLARESDLKRFSYAAIRSGGRGRDYRDAVAWLVDAGLVTKVPRISKPGIPLAGYADETYFKLYLVDVGLLGAATNLRPQTIIEGNRLFTEYKGAYAEQYVCQQLVGTNKYQPYYWSADGKQTKGEVDFVVEREGSVLPIEVKADENVAGSSIAKFAKRYGIERAIRFSMLDRKDQDWLLNLPLYAADLL